MSTPPATPDPARPPGDPRIEEPNGGAPSAPADSIARRDADRSRHAAHADRRASRF